MSVDFEQIIAALTQEKTLDNGRTIPYLNQVAHKILDRDVDNLAADNDTEDEIRERTVNAALRAGLARLEHGLTLLEG